MAEPKPKQKPKPQADPAAELAKRAEELDAREAALQERESELDERKAALDEAADAEGSENGEADKPRSASAPVSVTYLGRPELIAADESGEPVEEDVYQGTDPWDDDRPVNIAVGETAPVSAEKAAQLQADFPGAFETS